MRINYISRNIDPSPKREGIYQVPFFFSIFDFGGFAFVVVVFSLNFCLQLLVNIITIHNPPINFRAILEEKTGILVTQSHDDDAS